MEPNPQETADLVTFTEEIRSGKLHFLCSVMSESYHSTEKSGWKVFEDFLKKSWHVENWYNLI